MPRLEVKVGPDRFHMETCRVNDTHRPHEIDTEHFVGRVVVRIINAPGAREGEEGREYFKDRSRKFCIQIEGRFKKQWNGDEIQFGSDFDKFIDFPRAPFNAGMRVAKYIDPCTFYEETPPSGRPFIMSPYCACMNVLCAWPAPSRAHEAVVVLRHTTKSANNADSPISRPGTPLLDPEKKGDSHRALVASPDLNGQDDDDDDDEESVVPREGLSRSGSKKVNGEGTGSKDTDASGGSSGKKAKRKTWLGVFSGGHSEPKEARVLKKYWRFVGFKDEPRVRAMLEAHHAKLESKRKPSHHLLPDLDNSQPRRSSSANTSESGPEAGDVQHGITSDHPTLRRLGTNLRGKLPKFSSDDPGTPQLKAARSGMSGDVSPIGVHSPSESVENFFTAPEPPQRSLSTSPSPLRQDSALQPAPAIGGLKRSEASAAILKGHEGAGQSRYSTEDDQKKGLGINTSGEVDSKPKMPELARITTAVRTEAERSAKTDGLKEGDFRLAEDLQRKARISEPGKSSWQSKLDDQLGPWRFDDPGTDMVEDNAFVFTNESLPVPKRRKYFASVENRKNFIYNPDVVYAASFFTDSFDFNTFNLSLGPVSLNIAKFFTSMPVRYTLRASSEEPSFCTISFQLVD
ncbi:unnamed protein product [Sympodiomycopsis kandeliae]